MLARFGLCLALGLLLAACAGSQETRVRTALEVFHDLVDPAYDLADTTCTARERAAVERYERPPHDPKDKADYLAIKDKCIEARRIFRAMREAHHRAATLLEQGYVRQADVELARVRQIWREYQQGEPP